MTTKVLKQYIILVSHPQVGQEDETMTAFSYAYDDIEAVEKIKSMLSSVEEKEYIELDNSRWKFQVLGMQSLEDFTKNYNRRILHLTQMTHPSPKNKKHLRAV